jgi:lipopolysaccharide export system permease protein
MRILDRYLVRSLLVPLAAATIAFLTIAVIVDLFEQLDTFLDHDVSPQVVAKYYVAKLQYLFILTLPVSTLIGILFSLGGMARRNELIAMTGSGISLYRILAPMLVAGLIISSLALLFTVEVVPRGNVISNDIYNHEIKGRPRITGSSRRDLNYLGDGGRFFLIRNYDGDPGTMEEVVIQQFSEGTLVHRIDAKRARWEDSRWVFRDGFIRRFREDGTVDVEQFAERVFPEVQEKPAAFLRVTREPNEMTLAELKDYTERTVRSGGDVTRLLVERHQRISFPFASFIVLLLGAPLTGAIRRGGHALGFALTLLVGFTYYVLLQVGKSLGVNGTLPPLLAAWLPNLVFIAVGGLGLWKTRK